MNACATGVISEITCGKSDYITSVNVRFAKYEYTVGISDTKGRPTLQQYSCNLATDTPEILTLQHEENRPKTRSFAVDNIQYMYRFHDFTLH